MLKGLELISSLLIFIASDLLHNLIRLALRRLRSAWLFIVRVRWTTSSNHESIEFGSSRLGSAIGWLKAADLLRACAFKSRGKVVTS